MKLPASDALRSAVNGLRDRFFGKALILLYHRVSEMRLDPQRLCVKSSNFGEHLEVLRRFGCVLSLRELIESMLEGRLPERALVVTFDDGYADNLRVAKPLLERYGVPATVFVAAGYLKQDREFWWDELENLLLQPGKLPETIDLKTQGKAMSFPLGDGILYGEDAYRSHWGWHVEMTHDPSPRHRIYRSLCRLLRELSVTERRHVLDELRSCTRTEPVVRPSHGSLSPEEVGVLADGGLIEVGAHTVSHTALSVLSVEEQRWEVQESKRTLEEILGCSVQCFAYPFGGRSDFTEGTKAVVRQAGFQSACANVPGMIWRRSDLFELPRVLVRDWDGDEFTRMLGRWFRD